MSEGSLWSAVYGAYARRLRFSVAATLSFLALVPGAIGLLGEDQWPRAYASLAGAVVLMVWAGLVSGHLKQVLARPQSRLLPGYPRAQVLAGASLVLPVCALSALLHWIAGFSALASIALTLLAASLYWAGPYLFNQGTVLVFVGPSLLAVVATPRLLGWWSQVSPAWSGETWSALAILLAAALTGFVTHRMLLLNESFFEYSRDPSLAWRSGRRVDQDIPFTDVFDRFLPWVGRYRVSGLTSRFGANFAARVQLWRVGMSRTSPMVTGLSLAGMIALVGAAFLIHPENGPRTQAGVLVFYLMFFALVRATYVHRRKERLQYEALHPVSREGMVKEMGAATALDIAETWLFLWLGTLAARGLGLFPDVSWTTLIGYAAYTAGATVLGIGLAPWALRLQGNWPPLLALYLGTLAVGAPVAFALTRGPGIEAVASWAAAGAVLAGIGVALGYTGYRSWCDLELGRMDPESR
jgi:hypothetical protein